MAISRGCRATLLVIYIFYGVCRWIDKGKARQERTLRYFFLSNPDPPLTDSRATSKTVYFTRDLCLPRSLLFSFSRTVNTSSHTTVGRFLFICRRSLHSPRPLHLSPLDPRFDIVSVGIRGRVLGGSVGVDGGLDGHLRLDVQEFGRAAYRSFFRASPTVRRSRDAVLATYRRAR